MLRHLKLALPLLLVLICLGFFAAPRLRYYWANDEEKIRLSLDGLAQGGRDRHIGDILTHISESYSDRWHKDRENLRRSLTYILFSRYKRVKVELSEIEIEFDPADSEKALTRFHAVILGSTHGDQDPNEPFVRAIRGSDRFLLAWRKEGSRWRVVEALAPGEKEKKR